jgi:hypothetical protein
MQKINKRYLAVIDEYFINGLKQKEAYISVYKNVTNKAADVNASKLFARPEVQAEIAKRQALTSAKFEITRESLVKDLNHIKNKNLDAFPPSAIKAIEVMAKMLGLNEPDKVEISGELPIQINIIKPNESDSKEKGD